MSRLPILLVLLVLPVLLLLGCPAPTIDGLDSTTVKISLEEIKRELSPDDRARLEQAVLFIVALELDAALGGSYGSASTANVDRDVAAILDGKTASEIIAYAEAKRVEATRS